MALEGSFNNERLLEERIDAVGIAIARNQETPRFDQLEETGHLPRCCATFRVTG